MDYESMPICSLGQDAKAKALIDDMAAVTA